ncbi:MAG: c-type cytochrome [Pirellulaceae bacterium]|nr:c-type cytochrome [Pirellulaceae bacterium]
MRGLMRLNMRPGTIARSCLAMALVCSAATGLHSALRAATPELRVLDNRLDIRPFAEAPQIVTPTGIAVDSRGRVMVIESHTHFPLEGYGGPKFDRIRWLQDTDNDGRADRVTSFYEGGVATMNMAFYADDTLFVATRREVFRLFDDDGDGVAERRVEIAHLETKGDYPHNGLSGFAFDVAGTVYFGMGENLGADYALVGADGTRLSGGGEGGNIYRIQPDGSGLQLVATGFWNPFHLCFDQFGRLFAVDNDPDSRPPCRLLHIVDGGDYGYRFRNGRRGTHPFTAWFGGLPGTLGLVAETGEAPSGLMVCDSTGWPADYQGTLLATSWGNHAIQKYKLERRGASFQSQAETVIRGGANFRPVGLVFAPDGSIYVSDWVDRSYNVHGKGRVWRIENKSFSPNATRGRDVPPAHRAARLAQFRREVASAPADRSGKVDFGKPEIAVDQLAVLASHGRLNDETAREALVSPSADLRAAAVSLVSAKALGVLGGERDPLVLAAVARRRRDATWTSSLPLLKSGDPFLRQAARRGLQASFQAQTLASSPPPADADARLAWALLQRETNAKSTTNAARLLRDPDPRIRLVAVRWVAEMRFQQLREPLLESIATTRLSGDLLDAYAAALHLLDTNQPPAEFEKQQQDAFIRLIELASLEDANLADALRRVPPNHSWWNGDRMDVYSKHARIDVRIEAVRSLRESRLPDAQARLRGLVGDRNQPEPVRTEALIGLDAADPASRRLLIAALSQPAQVATALDGFANVTLTDRERALVEEAAEATRTRMSASRLLDKDWKAVDRPRREDVAGWDGWFSAKAGDAARGRRLFFHPRGPRCYVCHRVDGRGGVVGPDLSSLGPSVAGRLIQSLVDPAAEVAPQFTPWLLELNDGKVYTGVLVTEQGENQTYADQLGELRIIDRKTIEMRVPRSASVMPNGLTDRLTDQELRDLLAFLKTKTRSQ